MKILFTTFLLPPGLLLVLMAVFGVWAWRSRELRAHEMRDVLTRMSIWIGLLVFVGAVVCTPAFGLMLSHILTGSVRGKDLPDPQKADAIVVLTGGMVDAGPVGWLPKPESVHRLAVAYELQRMINLRLPVIVSGGHTAGVQNPSEAAVAASFFARQRTELTPTELEESSNDTYESALQLAPILAKRGVHNVLLVTSDIHMLRSLATFRARGIDPVPAPAMVLPVRLGIKKYVPSPYGLLLTSEALYELYGTATYLLSGRISWGDLAYVPAVQDNLKAQAAAIAATPGQDMTLPTLESKTAGQQLLAPPAAAMGQATAAPAPAAAGAEIPLSPQGGADVHIAEPTTPAAPKAMQIGPAGAAAPQGVDPGDVQAVD